MRELIPRKLYLLIFMIRFELRFFRAALYSLLKIGGEDTVIQNCEEIQLQQNMKILILAPHFDDEILGCGSILHIAGKLNCKVSLVFITDGKLGGVNYTEANDYSALRYKESIDAVKELCYSYNEIEYHNLLVPDSFVHKNIDRITEYLTRLDFDFVFVPFKEDPHSDHASLFEVVLNLKRLKTFSIIEYFVHYKHLASLNDKDVLLKSEMPFNLAYRSLKKFRTQGLDFDNELINRRLNTSYCTFFRECKHVTDI